MWPNIFALKRIQTREVPSYLYGEELNGDSGYAIIFLVDLTITINELNVILVYIVTCKTLSHVVFLERKSSMFFESNCSNYNMTEELLCYTFSNLTNNLLNLFIKFFNPEIINGQNIISVILMFLT